MTVADFSVSSLWIQRWRISDRLFWLHWMPPPREIESWLWIRINCGLWCKVWVLGWLKQNFDFWIFPQVHVGSVTLGGYLFSVGQSKVAIFQNSWFREECSSHNPTTWRPCLKFQHMLTTTFCWSNDSWSFWCCLCYDLTSTFSSMDSFGCWFLTQGHPHPHLSSLTKKPKMGRMKFCHQAFWMPQLA